MNTMAGHETIAPEVRDFLTVVRRQLADLDPDDQRDITEGLEADLTDLVAERGGDALGDPVLYARELRAAAGLDPEMARTRRRVDLPAGIHGFLDDCHRVWDRLLEVMPGDPAGFLAALRPLWWVLRGWLAVEMVATWLGDWSLTIVPGSSVAGAGAVLLGVVLSIQLGRGKGWLADGWRRNALLRVVLVGLNCFAIAMIPVVLNGLDHGSTDRYGRGFDQGYQTGLREMRDRNGAKAGLYADGKWISQIYPYDAQGRPLVGVQLFNQIGQPINVVTQPEYKPREYDDEGNEIDENGNRVESGLPQLPRIYYPWSNGATELLNVFPLPSRLQDIEKPSPTAFAEPVPPTIGAFPMAHVPVVSLPGIRTGLQKPDVQ